jgi:alkyl sulfatase BDS1-like metallo-beta-lactamase superfamily hydrolase
MGPIFGHVPNLYTLRGDKIRYVQWFIDSVQRVIDLSPEVLITGHGDPRRGAVAIRQELSRIREAVRYLKERTFEGMNAGVDLWTLMGSVSLPPELLRVMSEGALCGHHFMDTLPRATPQRGATHCDGDPRSMLTNRSPPAANSKGISVASRRTPLRWDAAPGTIIISPVRMR